jgi:hypothetical protein
MNAGLSNTIEVNNSHHIIFPNRQTATIGAEIEGEAVMVFNTCGNRGNFFPSVDVVHRDPSRRYMTSYIERSVATSQRENMYGHSVSSRTDANRLPQTVG